MTNFQKLLVRALSSKDGPDDYVVIEPHHWFEIVYLDDGSRAMRERYPGYIGPWMDEPSAQNKEGTA